jgi:hypothetical protein
MRQRLERAAIEEAGLDVLEPTFDFPLCGRVSDRDMSQEAADAGADEGVSWEQ